MRWTVLVAMAHCCALAAGGAAQDTGDEAVQDSTQSFAGAAFVGFDLVVPAGEFRENADLTWGLAFGGLFYLNEPRSLAVRGDMHYLAYGYSRKVRDLFFDEHHTNSITSFGVGPQYNTDFGSGRLFAFGTIGVSQFATSRTWTWFRGDESDNQLALTAGGGFSVNLMSIDPRLALHFAASYRHHGATRYGTDGDGPVMVSDANLMIFRVGLSHQFGGRSPHLRTPRSDAPRRSLRRVRVARRSERQTVCAQTKRDVAMDTASPPIPHSSPVRVVRRMRLLFFTSVVLAGVAWASACGDGATEPPPAASDPPRATTVSVTPATADLTALGATVQLAAEVRDQNGNAMAGAAVNWSSDAATVATVSASGLVVAADNGTATITAMAGSASGKAAVTVMQAPDSVAVLAAQATIASLGDTLRLVAEAFDANGHVIAGEEFSWKSDDPSVATVDNSGLVTAVRNGEATITASAGEGEGSEVVRVAQSAASVQVSPSAAEVIAFGATVQLTAEAFDANGHSIAGEEFSWKSDDPSVATVDNSGLVTGVGNGEATISASAGEGEGSAVVGVAELEVLASYLTQAVQSLEHPVPLVAGERALLRVFITATHRTAVGIPPVRARFYLNGTERHVADLPATTTPIPTEVVEGDLSSSANVEIPADIIQPGLEMVVEIDPDRMPDSAAIRIPGTGRMAVDVQELFTFDLTLIPFIWNETGDSSIVDLISAMSADPETHEMLTNVVTLLPVGDLEVRAHEPVLSTTNNAGALLARTVAIRALEGGRGHYLGMMSRPTTGAHGLAHRAARSAFSLPHPFVVGHEIGHTFDLSHADCGTSIGGLDPLYPYPDGTIGTWGFDFRSGGRLVPPDYTDLMGYCNQRFWISNYHFKKALRFRLANESAYGAAATAAPVPSLLLWGSVDADGLPRLEPAFVVDAPPSLPRNGGEYEITGHMANGRELFSLQFDMPATADGDGSSSFAFVLPVQSGWEANLASITLFGLDGSFTLDLESDRPMAILRNPRNGQVRGILRDLPPLTQADAGAMGQNVGTGLEVLFSRGIPSGEAWRK